MLSSLLIGSSLALLERCLSPASHCCLAGLAKRRRKVKCFRSTPSPNSMTAPARMTRTKACTHKIALGDSDLTNARCGALCGSTPWHSVASSLGLDFVLARDRRPFCALLIHDRRELGRRGPASDEPHIRQPLLELRLIEDELRIGGDLFLQVHRHVSRTEEP